MNEYDPQSEENDQEPPQWKDLLPKRWKLKLLLYAVGAANAAVGIALLAFGLDSLFRYQNANFLFPITLSSVFDYIATVHFRWTTLCGLDETFDYRKKLKPYIVLWSILVVALCIECIYLIRKGFFPS